VLLERVLAMLLARGFEPVNVDVTILAERPRIAPHREAMRRRLAQMLELPPEVVNIKATTTEQLGLIGRGEGLAAQAIALVESLARDG
jgi:2-C-methyl-D-erythritol 2,4-cyclodiphosphate synthase